MYASADATYGTSHAARGASSVGRAFSGADKKGRVLFGTFVGTLACFILFVSYYSEAQDDSSAPG